MHVRQCGMIVKYISPLLYYATVISEFQKVG